MCYGVIIIFIDRIVASALGEGIFGSKDAKGEKKEAPGKTRTICHFANVHQMYTAQPGFSLGSITTGEKGKDTSGMPIYRMAR
jgi:hypothetical protein